MCRYRQTGRAEDTLETLRVARSGQPRLSTSDQQDANQVQHRRRLHFYACGISAFESSHVYFGHSTGFQGNPAAVILLRPDQDIPDETRLAIASEFALSETAFARPVAGYQSSAPVFDLRWWTPRAEIDLCA